MPNSAPTRALCEVATATAVTPKGDAFVLGVQAGEFDHFVKGIEP